MGGGVVSNESPLIIKRIVEKVDLCFVPKVEPWVAILSKELGSYIVH